MKRNRTIIEVFVTLLLTALISDMAIPISAAANKPKSAGRTTSAIPNTILNGKGAPLNNLGIDGDFYLDTRSLQIYGPKKTGKWPLPQSLQGPAGVPGVDGKNGSEGKTISNASSVAGPTGAQGEKGEKGDKGEPGVPGASGAQGPSGAKGETGATGPQGATGPSGGGGGTTGPQGTAGAKGDTGATGATGATGSAGATGAKGDTGATGPSNVYANNIPSWTLSTSTAKSYATSTFFLSYKSSKSYLYSIYLYGQSDATASVFAVEIIHSDGSTSKFGYSAVENINFSGEPKVARYTFTITGVITPVGGDVSLAIRVIDDAGATGGANSMTFSGIVFSTLVGAVGTL